jgi:hypothetical protein
LVGSVHRQVFFIADGQSVVGKHDFLDREMHTEVKIQGGGGRERAGATFDWLFFDNSKVINFDD